MTSSNRRIASAAVGAAGAAALIYSTFIEPYQIETVELELECKRLPIEFDGYRVLQLSDLHMRKFGRREKLLRGILDKLPIYDLVLITGDLIHTPGGVVPFIELTQSIRAVDGIFAVFGNSEHKNGVRSRKLAEILEEVGVHSLINAHTVITREKANLFLLGVDDPASQKDDIPASVKGVPENEFKLLMMHSPDPIGLAAAYGIDVVLSGHTHGGQIKLPIIGPLFTNSVLGLTMDHGLFKADALYKLIGFRAGRTQLYVTRGVGVSSLALRFRCRPEITSITLRRS